MAPAQTHRPPADGKTVVNLSAQLLKVSRGATAPSYLTWIILARTLRPVKRKIKIKKYPIDEIVLLDIALTMFLQNILN